MKKIIMLVFSIVAIIVSFCACIDSSNETVYYADEEIYESDFFDDVVVGETTYYDLFGESTKLLYFGSESSTGYFRTEDKIFKIDFQGEKMIISSIAETGDGGLS